MVKIIADSTCDLSADLIKKYDVDILPLHILLGEKEYEDGKSITPEEIFQWSDEHETTPKTSAPAVETVMDLLRPYTQAGQECICFCISESMSTCGNVIRMAAEELEGQALVHVIDSQNLSTGIGLLVIEAAIMAQEGMSAEQIIARIEQLRCAGKLCGGYAGLSASRRPLWRTDGNDGRSIEAAPEDCCGRRGDAQYKKISRKYQIRGAFLCQRYGDRVETGKGGSCVYHTFRL